ncbi:MAG: ATP-binding protein [Bacteroidales bacterium]|nr:ATP-binding protein [Bacteroidales bacterium]
MDRVWTYISQTVRKNTWVFLIAVAACVLSLAFLAKRSHDITALTARKVERRLEMGMQTLEGYMQQAMVSPRSEWPEIKGLPEDMVVYRYVNDTLKSWYNQFTLDNDDISQRMYIQHFTNLRYNVVSPLSEVDTAVSYMNIGPSWYLVKGMRGDDGTFVIGGLMVRNTLDNGTYNGVNRRLKLSDRFAVYPVSYSGGSVVSVEGIPQFKVLQENATVIAVLPDSWAVWLSVFLVIVGILLFLARKRTRGRALLSAGLITVACMFFFLIGYGMRTSAEVFSPMIYADGSLLYSLGAVLIINLWILSMVLCFFLSRRATLSYIMARNTKKRMSVYAGAIVLLSVLLLVYVHLSFRSLIFNSNINLELFQVGRITMQTVYVYVSYLMLFLALYLLLQMLGPAVKLATGRGYDVFSLSWRSALSLLGASYLIFMASSLSFRRESGRAEIWANRLAIDRNLPFEIQLRSVEGSIANDGLISSLISMGRDFNVITSRINESYLSRIMGDYDVDMYMFRDSDADAMLLRYFNERLQNGTPLADNSRFMYSRSAVGRAQYTGIFTYYTRVLGVVRLLIAIEDKADNEISGYGAIVNAERPGTVHIPRDYSYAKYLGGKLVGYHGDFAYPTVFSGRMERAMDQGTMSHVKMDNYIHFVTSVSDDEVIVISRRIYDVTKYLVALFMLSLFAFSFCSIPKIGAKRRRQFAKNYYKQRINTVLLLSLTAVLISMASVSVLFIYRRNNSNLNDLMVNKINTIQSLVEANSRYLHSPAELLTNDFRNQLGNVSAYTKSDISLFSTDGRIVVSTFPEIFERLTIGTRLNGEAYENIIHNSKRYYIHKEKIEDRSIYTMSAPVFNSDGDMLAIVSTPYTDAGIGFRDEALFHACFIFTVFFLLLLLSALFSTKVVEKMFGPLIDMGTKMGQAKTNGLEYIFYDRDDEISTLVDSYNRMVHDLSESSKQAAQIERDRAWSEMARQVAHEIKNPLTPIKLQIQRIIRLKSKNDPSWQDKFDSIVNVVMDSIDQLTDTANEFSTFAKLYGEEPVDINLDKLATDEVALFGDRENISIQYIGLQNSWVSGPKPQLTRVFVNLLTNSVQAIEGVQREAAEEGREVPKGEIMLSIRNSNKDGFYDIVFEDNGPGVKDENRSHLFTPNFTTKSSGTGLGLAICKNIIDRCGGEIFYSRSFTLGGACFTIRYPKK